MVGMISGWWEWPVGNQQEEKPVKGWGRASRGSRRRGREKNILPASHLYSDRARGATARILAGISVQ